VDCVIRGGEQPDSTLVARKLGMIEFITCASADYLARYGVPQHPNDLVRHKCINYFSAKNGRIYEWDFSRDGERIVLNLEGHVALNDADAYRAAGMAGLGVMQVPEVTIRAALKDGTLVRILSDWQTDTLPIYVMYPQNRHLSAKVRVFVDWIAELFERRAFQQYL
jgi:LysR family transcriptional regulator for bpeEF and oprC